MPRKLRAMFLRQRRKAGSPSEVSEIDTERSPTVSLTTP